ncbi:unnamed protein product [Rotaria sp. Silwood2]|nr:unnamed protein product [Rotaria sp. Silwood2]
MADSERQYQEKFKQLMEERRKWDEEKATIEKIAASASPIVKLNVGGEAMTTSRATLTLDEGSLLATMFSGKWDNKLMKDTDGCIFLDYDPVRFIDSKQSTITSVAKVVQSEEESERFGTVSSSTVQLTNDNRTCKTTVDSNWQYLLGTLTYSTGKHRIRLKLEFGRTNILMGICSQNKPPTGPQFYDKPTTHGWFIHGYMMKNGQGSHPGWPQVAVNDILELTINCDERSLSILNENSRAQNNMQPGLSGGIKGNKK